MKVGITSSAPSEAAESRPALEQRPDEESRLAVTKRCPLSRATRRGMRRESHERPKNASSLEFRPFGGLLSRGRAVVGGQWRAALVASAAQMTQTNGTRLRLACIVMLMAH